MTKVRREHKYVYKAYTLRGWMVERLISPNTKILLNSVASVVFIALQITHAQHLFLFLPGRLLLTTSWAVGDEGHIVVVDNDPGSAVRGHVDCGAAGADHVTVLALGKTWNKERY